MPASSTPQAERFDTFVSTKLRIADGVKWRVYSDGIVVFVAATCETHILSNALQFLFQIDGVFVGAVDLTLDNSKVGIGSPLDRHSIGSDMLVELVGLKIFEPLH